MRKKMIVALLACTMLMVVGCGGAPENGVSQESQTEPATIVQTEAQTEEATIASGTVIELTLENYGEYFEDKVITTEKEVKNSFGEVTGTETETKYAFDLKDEYKDLVKCDGVVFGTTGCECYDTSLGYPEPLTVVPNADPVEDGIPSVKTADGETDIGKVISWVVGGYIPAQDETKTMIVIRPGKENCNIKDYEVVKVVGKLIYK